MLCAFVCANMFANVCKHITRECIYVKCIGTYCCERIKSTCLHLCVRMVVCLYVCVCVCVLLAISY